MHQEAIKAYNKAIEINPGDADVYRGLALTYEKLGMEKEANGTVLWDLLKMNWLRYIMPK